MRVSQKIVLLCLSFLAALPTYLFAEALELVVDECQLQLDGTPIPPEIPISYSWYRASGPEEYQLFLTTTNKHLTVLVPTLGHFRWKATCSTPDGGESGFSNELLTNTYRHTEVE